MAEWLVTPTNPLRSVDGMDFERCAALHNYLHDLADTGAGLEPDSTETRTWWEVYEANDWPRSDEEPLPSPQRQPLSKLRSTTLEFLKRARWNTKASSLDHNLFLYIHGLHVLDDMIEFAQRALPGQGGDDETGRFIYLYRATEFSSHAGGLVYVLIGTELLSADTRMKL